MDYRIWLIGIDIKMPEIYLFFRILDIYRLVMIVEYNLINSYLG